MEKNFDIVKDEKKGLVNYILNFEEIVNKTEIIIYNKTFIEIPKILVFSKEEQGLLADIGFLLQNPGLETLKVEEEQINDMIKVIETKVDDCILLDCRKIVPEKKIRINLKRIRDNLIYLRDYGDTIIVNNILFTTSELEFHGSGMFSGRMNVFYILEEELKTIKDYLLK